MPGNVSGLTLAERATFLLLCRATAQKKGNAAAMGAVGGLTLEFQHGEINTQQVLAFRLLCLPCRMWF